MRGGYSIEVVKENKTTEQRIVRDLRWVTGVLLDESAVCVSVSGPMLKRRDEVGEK